MDVKTNGEIRKWVASIGSSVMLAFRSLYDVCFEKLDFPTTYYFLTWHVSQNHQSESGPSQDSKWRICRRPSLLSKIALKFWGFPAFYVSAPSFRLLILTSFSAKEANCSNVDIFLMQSLGAFLERHRLTIRGKDRLSEHSENNFEPIIKQCLLL